VVDRHAGQVQVLANALEERAEGILAFISSAERQERRLVN
jgi:hypothetical protein